MASKKGGKGRSKAKAKAPAKASAGKGPEEFEAVDDELEAGVEEEFEPVEEKGAKVEKEERVERVDEFEPLEDKGGEFEPVEEREERAEEFLPIEEGPPVEIKTSGMKVRGGEDADYEPTIDEVLAYATGKTKRPSEAPPPRELRSPRAAGKGGKGRRGAKGEDDPLADIFEEKGK